MAVMSLATAPAIPLSSSTLNPNAPMFVPLAYRAVEDFSGEWWALVQSSPWFRDYWLRERFHDPQYEEEDDDACFSDTHDLALPEADLYFAILEQEEEERRERELVSIGRLKWKEVRRRFVPHAPRWYAEKAPKKIVSAKQVSPRTIQQPR